MYEREDSVSLPLDDQIKFINPFGFLMFLGGIRDHSQPAFTCSKLTIETLEQGVKYVQS